MQASSVSITAGARLPPRPVIDVSAAVFQWARIGPRLRRRVRSASKSADTRTSVMGKGENGAIAQGTSFAPGKKREKGKRNSPPGTAPRRTVCHQRAGGCRRLRAILPNKRRGRFRATVFMAGSRLGHVEFQLGRCPRRPSSNFAASGQDPDRKSGRAAEATWEDSTVMILPGCLAHKERQKTSSSCIGDTWCFCCGFGLPG